jgi:protein-disulfide isomerase
MRLRTQFLWVASAVLFCLTSLSHGQSPIATGFTSKEVVAEVGGQKLFASDLQQRQGGKLLQAQYQYYLTARKALDQLIDDELLEIEARNKHITVDQLLEQVYKDLKDPTEDQLQVYYEGMDSEEPYATVREKILDHIRELRRTKARTAYAEQLRNRSDVRVLLQPPSADVNIEHDYVRGSRNAPVVLIEFADYECPYCQKITDDLHKLQKEYGDKLSLVFKDFPLPMHHSAEKAAEAARCAGEQGKFWEMHDVLFYSKNLGLADLQQHARVLKLDGERFDNCLNQGLETSAVKQDLQEGKNLGLTGTPSFFVNGHFFSGAVDYKTLHQMVELQLQSSRAETVLSKK